MNIFLKLSIILCLLFAIGFVVAKKQPSCGDSCSDCQIDSANKSGCSTAGDSTSADSCSAKDEESCTKACDGCDKGAVQDVEGLQLPKMIDFGKNECIPCKMMEPVLERLKENYSGKFKVEFINIAESPETIDEYGLTGIPTQIFFDAEGKELFRNVGFLPEEDILEKWKELGVEL